MPTVKQLNAEHPEHMLYGPAWDAFDLLHVGGVRLKAKATDFLIKRPKEPGDVYSERIKRFCYQNILGTVLGWYQACLFRTNPEVEMKPEGAGDGFYEDFRGDCDRAQRSLDDFFREVFGDLMLYSRAYVLIDKPKAVAPEAIATQADEQAAGLDRPYLVRYTPSQVLNWSVDDAGNLDWIVIRTEQEQRSFLGKPVIATTWYYFDRAIYRTFRDVSNAEESKERRDEKDVPMIAEGPHVLAKQNQVPVRRVAVPDALWFADRTYLQICDHLNQENSYAWALFMANLPLPVVTGQPSLESVSVSEHGFLHLTDPLAKFSWTEPAGTSFEHSQARLASLREEIYRSFYLQAQGRSSAATPAMQSGYSKELDMQPAADVLNVFGDIIRPAMQAVLNDVAAARGEKIEFDVRGFRFQTKPTDEDLKTVQAAHDLGIPSATLEKELDKRIARTLLEDANEDTVAKVDQEIDTAPTRSDQAKKDEAEKAKAFEGSLRIAGRQAAARAA